MPGGTAIVPFDSPHRDRLADAAGRHAATVLTFGMSPDADVHAIETMRTPTGGTFVTARLGEEELSFTIAQPGAHWVSNALGVLAAVRAAGGDPALAGLALAELGGLAGRGARFTTPLAGGGSALVLTRATMPTPSRCAPRCRCWRPNRRGGRLAVLGEMGELGDRGGRYHADLVQPVVDAGVDHVILVGAGMRPLANALEGKVDFVHVPDAAAASDRLKAVLAAGDVVLIKGSNFVGLSAVVAGLPGGKT